MPTLSWIIERMWVKPTSGTHTDVVVTANWRCNSVETVGAGDEAKTYFGTAYGSCDFTPPSGSFTPFIDLQPEQVLDWCFSNGVDKTAIEANVTAQINNQINPPVIAPPLPWLKEVSSSSPNALRAEQIVDPIKLPTSDVPPSVDGMTTNILG